MFPYFSEQTPCQRAQRGKHMMRVEKSTMSKMAGVMNLTCYCQVLDTHHEHRTAREAWPATT